MEAPLKLILRGSVVDNQDIKVGVVSVVFATTDKDKAQNKINELNAANHEQNDYYMVYSVPLDIDLTNLEHYPSIAITPEDLNC